MAPTAGDRPARPVQSAEALPERVERRGLGDESVQIEIDTHFQALRGDHEQWPRLCIVRFGPGSQMLIIILGPAYRRGRR